MAVRKVELSGSNLGPIASMATAGAHGLALAEHFGQFGEVRRHAAGLVLGEQLGRRAPPGFVLEMIRAATPAATRMIE